MNTTTYNRLHDDAYLTVILNDILHISPTSTVNIMRMTPEMGLDNKQDGDGFVYKYKSITQQRKK